MSGESASELIDRARQSGLFPAELLEKLTQELTTETAPDQVRQHLHERGLLTPEQWNVFAGEISISVESEAQQLVPVPNDDAGEAIVPTALPSESLFDTTTPARKRLEPPMNRQTMWTWFAFGGALWLVGFLVLGIWLGGCFDSSPQPNPKNGRSAP